MSELKTWEKFVVFVGGILITIGAFVLAIVVMAIPTYIAWNAVMPDVLSVKPITFGQAIILCILSDVLFKTSLLSEQIQKARP